MEEIIPYKEITEKDNVIMNSGIIHITNRITLKQKQAWIYMLYRAFPNLEKQRIFRMYQSDLMKAINYNSRNKENLRDLLRGLAKCTVEFNILNKDGTGRWLITQLLASCEIIENKGIIEYEFSEKLANKITNPLVYTKLNLLISKTFKSKHSLNIYMLAIDYIFNEKNSGEKIFSIDELKLYLGLIDSNGNELKKYRVVDIHNHILKKAEKEINEVSDITISITPVKKLRSKLITGFRFKMSIKHDHIENYKKIFININHTIKKSENIEAIKEKQENIDIQINNHELKEFFLKNSISITTKLFQKKVAELQKILGHENIENYLLFLKEYTEKEFKKGNVSNISGFFVSLLKEDLQIDNYIFKQEEKKKKLEEKRIQIELMLEKKINAYYENEMINQFQNYLEKNIESVEQKFIEIVSNKIENPFIKGYMITKVNNGVINKDLLLKAKGYQKIMLINELKKFENELGYKKLPFEQWKNKVVNTEFLENLRSEIEKELKYT